jgi:hypothetical protein
MKSVLPCKKIRKRGPTTTLKEHLWQKINHNQPIRTFPPLTTFSIFSCKKKAVPQNGSKKTVPKKWFQK